MFKQIERKMYFRFKISKGRIYHVSKFEMCVLEPDNKRGTHHCK